MPMSQRRELEVELIQRFDRLEINKHVGDFWFIIDSQWMRRWTQFVLGRADPPGPITNYNLFDRAEDDPKRRRESVLVQHASMARRRGGVMASRPDLRLKEGLHKVRDYRAVHPLVWYILRELYSCDDAPEICRWKVDIYSDEVTPTRKLRVETETHTKAVYELRRFVQAIKEEMGDGSVGGDA